MMAWWVGRFVGHCLFLSVSRSSTQLLLSPFLQLLLQLSLLEHSVQLQFFTSALANSLHLEPRSLRKNKRTQMRWTRLQGTGALKLSLDFFSAHFSLTWRKQHWWIFVPGCQVKPYSQRECRWKEDLNVFIFRSFWSHPRLTSFHPQPWQTHDRLVALCCLSDRWKDLQIMH